MCSTFSHSCSGFVLMLCYALDPVVTRVSNQLPSVEALAESIDVDALEESSSLMGSKYKGKKDDKAAANAEV